MGKKLYLECSSGISGDMFVASMLDLGADKKVLLQGLHSLPVDGFDIKITRVKKSGLDACDFDVILDSEHENHDHDMEYLHGHWHGKPVHCHGEEMHEHVGEQEYPHTNAEMHEHEYCHLGEKHGNEYCHRDEIQGHLQHQESVHSHHHHEHRGLPEVLDIIEKSDITSHAKKIAEEIFKVLAKAEAKAHGVPESEVHFHEVGAVDSIVDIVAGAVCVDNLGIDEVIVSKVSEGTGMIRCQHGMLPVPVPAVANIVSEHEIKLHMTGIEGELVTPTGAAIVAALRTSDKLPEEFLIEKVGLGAGKREYECAGVLRAMMVA